MDFYDLYERVCVFEHLEDENRKHHYLLENDNKLCRFCGKRENETVFDKSAHAVSEMVGNKWLFSYRECKSCNTIFGQTYEDSFGKYVLPMKIVSQIFGKKKTLGYSEAEGQIRINKEMPVLPEFNQDIKAMISVNSGSSILLPEEDGFMLELKRKTYVPQMIYFALLKMALTIMPTEEFTRYLKSSLSLKYMCDKLGKMEPEKIQEYLGDVRVCGFEEFIPGPERFDGISVELYRLKKDNEFQRPYMYFCLNFGNYSLQIPLLTDEQQGKNISTLCCVHNKQSQIKKLKFNKVEEVYRCHFHADMKEMNEEQKEKLEKCLKMKDK